MEYLEGENLAEYLEHTGKIDPDEAIRMMKPLTVTAPAVSAVSLSEKNISLIVDDTRALSATVSPYDANDKNVSWKSSNTNIVTVDSYGNIKAIAAGTAQITASAGSKSDICNVTVSLPTVSNVTVSKTDLHLESGQAHTLTATITPTNASNSAITWSSDNQKVATVDSSGRVTAVASGTAKITAQAGGKQASCTVTITTPVQSITLPSEQTVELGRTYTVDPTFKPSNADDLTFTLKTSDSSILSVKDNKFTPLKAGVATITVTTPNGKSDSCTITVIGEAELTLVQKPSKSTYYIGDTIDTSGLKLGYTDSTGKYSEITKGFTLSGYDMYNSGTQTVKVKYEGLTIKFDITVKTPSIEIRQIPFGENQSLIGVVTEPENVTNIKWYSSNEEIFYFEGRRLNGFVEVSSGTALATAVMRYNGIEYEDSCSISVKIIEEVKEYYFNP